MGLFTSKKRSDEELETVSTGDVNEVLPAPRKGPPPPPPAEALSEPPRPVEPPMVKAEAPRPSPPPPPAPSQAATPALPFGIDDAVALVRQLPTRNTDLVMQVV